MAKKAKAEAPVVVDENPCAVRGCGAARLPHSSFCRSCDQRTTGAPNSLLARVWAAGPADMPQAAAAMTQWLETQR